MFIQSMMQAAEKKNVNTPVSNQTYDLVSTTKLQETRVSFLRKGMCFVTF